MNARFFVQLCVAFMAIGLSGLSGPAWSQQAVPRVALVIGNADYPEAGTPLPTVINDVRAVADALRRSDFDVALKENAGKADMQGAIDAFTGKIRKGTVALLYFGGFGVQTARQNYLIPVDAHISSGEDVQRDGISLDAIVAEMARKGAQIKIVIIDASRQNPFEPSFRPTSAGLAALGAPDDTLTLYSELPGKVISDGTGENSLFVQELIKELQVSTLTAEEAFNKTRIDVSHLSNGAEIPWVSSSLLEEFSFVRPQSVASAPPLSAPAVSPPAPRPSPRPPAVSSPAPSPPPPTSVVSSPAPPPPAPVVSSPAPSPPVAPAASPPAPIAASPTPTPPPTTAPIVSPPARTVSSPAPSPRSPAAPVVAPAVPPVPTLASIPPKYKPGEIFRDCPDCGEMVIVGPGLFDMGSGGSFEEPMHRVFIAKPFAIGRYLVTFREWDLCIASGSCKYRPDDQNWGRGDRPVIDISWLDAKEFLKWLSDKTGQIYRLPSEAEWEYAARAGTSTPFWWGREVGKGNANCLDCGAGGNATLPVGTFKPNAFGLFDTAGNAAEWVEDCWNDTYRRAPHDGAAWNEGQCQLRVLRGGAFDSDAKYIRSAARFRYDYDVRYPANGFRVVRELR